MAAPAAVLGGGCAVVQRAGMAVLYQKAAIPESRISRDIAYGPDARHRLDLFLPDGPPGWPTVLFIHGGSWTGGDKALEIGGQDIYGNIGRFLAANGIGAAVINYRLQPRATWRDQVQDVAQATAWVHSNIAARGGRADRLFLSGHSAGAQLAAYTGLHPRLLAQAGIPAGNLRGIIAVSGTGYDLADAPTYALGHSMDYYRSVFDPGGTTADWQEQASTTTYIRPGAPPFLILYGGHEEKAMIRQSVRLHEALAAARVPARMLPIPGQTHGRIVLTLSRPDKTSGPALLDFIRQHSR